MNLFDRSDPCAPIHMVMTPLGSAVAFLSLISVFEMVVAGVRWPWPRRHASGVSSNLRPDFISIRTRLRD